MDRNYHGAPRIARMIQSTHVLIRLKSDIPLKRTSEILPDGSYRAEMSGNGVTVKVRVIEYWVTVEGQEVPEMFCLVTDLMDWEDYPAPELAALYRWRWDGSETALREAKAPLRGAGPGTGPMLRSGSPDLVRQELAAWAAGTGMTRGVVLDAAARRRARAEGAPCRAHGPAPGPVLRPRRAGGPVRDPPRERLLPGRDQRDREDTGTSSTGTGTAPASPSPRPLSRTRPRRTPPPASPPPSSPWPTPQPDQRKHRKPARKGTPPDRGPGRPGATRRLPACPPERQLPAVTKNRNYPQPVKHLKPTALGHAPGIALLPHSRAH